MFKKLMTAILAVMILIFGTVASAEILTFEGVGEHYIENENETLDAAKNQAKLLAERNVAEQIDVVVFSYSESQNRNLMRDEIISIIAGIMNVVDVKYFFTTEFDGVLLVKTVLTAEIDTDKIAELIECAATCTPY